MSPATQACLDQLGALARDAYLEMGVNVHDPDQARAIRATWLMVAHNQVGLAFILAAIGEVVGTEK